MEEGLLGSPTEDVREYALSRLRSSQPPCEAAGSVVEPVGTPCCGALRCNDACGGACDAPSKCRAVSYDPGSLEVPSGLEERQIFVAAALFADSFPDGLLYRDSGACPAWATSLSVYVAIVLVTSELELTPSTPGCVSAANNLCPTLAPRLAAIYVSSSFA